jgi:hypothetical protein
MVPISTVLYSTLPRWGCLCLLFCVLQKIPGVLYTMLSKEGLLCYILRGRRLVLVLNSKLKRTGSFSGIVGYFSFFLSLSEPLVSFGPQDSFMEVG